MSKQKIIFILSNCLMLDAPLSLILIVLVKTVESNNSVYKCLALCFHRLR